MASQEDIAHQQNLLATYRRNLAHVSRQAAKYGGEDDAPIHIANGIRDARANIGRIKGILRGWGVPVEDGPDEQEPGAETGASEPPAASPYPATPSAVPQLKSTAASSLKYDVFISYSRADEEWVEQTLLKTLEDAGLRACIDFRDFEVGRPTIINIQNAALESRHTVLVVTQDWIKSEWTLFESLLIRTKDPASLQRRTIPLRLQPVELPDFISMLTWVDFTRANRQENAWRQLFTALGAPETASSAPPTNNSSASQVAPVTPSASPPSGPPSFREIKMRALQKRLTDLIAEYEAATTQMSSALSEVDRIRLKRRADSLEQEISQVESDLHAL